jgi:EAL domain-containing protein (putative c-di-GMP-specific phosphodiesterase class I)
VAAWLAAGHAVPRVTVNISGHQLKRPDFLTALDAILQETGMPPQYLGLEFTESILMEEACRTAEILRELKGRRIHLSVDDFGTGYSSLTSLRHFPIGRIKIDRSFVADLAGNPDGSALIEAIIAMGRSLRVKVMAEGVENREQLEFLTLRGCDEAQGFLFARPLPAEELTAVLTEGRLSRQAGAAGEMFGGESATGDLADCRS